MTDAAPKDIYEALFALQSDPPVLVKDKEGQVGSQKTHYADLVQAHKVILPRLNALGLLWLTAPTLRMIPGPNGAQDPRFVLDWQLRHISSGTKLDGIYPLPAGANPMQNGSAISYAKRYALVAATNTTAEDEDDDGAGYRGRQGMAQRANVRQEQTTPTAQRASGPAPRAERARPGQQPALPAPTSPAPTGEPVRGRGGLVTLPMTKKLAITMQEVIGNDPEIRKQYIIDMIGREVASSKDLTFDEGRGLIDAFEKAKASPTGAADVIEIYRRINQAGDPGKAANAGRPAGQRSRNAAEAVSNGGDMGTEQAPWENEDPIV
jgi:hypothetical protein